MGTPVGPIVAALDALPELAGRVHGHRLPPDLKGGLPSLPRAVVRLISAVSEAGSRGDLSLGGHRVQLSAFAATDAGAVAIHEAARAALDRKPIDLGASGHMLMRCRIVSGPTPRPATADPSAEGGEVVHWTADYMVDTDRPGPNS